MNIQENGILGVYGIFKILSVEKVFFFTHPELKKNAEGEDSNFAKVQPTVL